VPTAGVGLRLRARLGAEAARFLGCYGRHVRRHSPLCQPSPHQLGQAPRPRRQPSLQCIAKWLGTPNASLEALAADTGPRVASEDGLLWATRIVPIQVARRMVLDDVKFDQHELLLVV